MLWYKGWLETRFRLCFALGCMGLILFSLASHAPHPNAAIFARLQYTGLFVLVFICVLLAGSGIATQPALGASKGLHGSTLFTLSLPVSRFRLLAVRAGIGWLEAAGVVGAFCYGMWLLAPPVRTSVTVIAMFEYAGTLIVCASALYFLSVLLATFLDDPWRTWSTMIAIIALWWLSNHTPLPAFANIFRAMGKGSPLVAHTMPWTAMAFSIALSAVLFFVALKVAQRREY